ncbi:MAG: class B sortase [Clostridiales bacterium]|nr:class B sortase [Clostridiales bacterium]
MKKGFRKGAVIFLAAVCGISCVLLGSRLHDYETSDLVYKEAQEIAFSAPLDLPEEPVPLADEPVLAEPVPEAPAEEPDPLQVLDLEALRQVNAYVMGWILIPDTEISYPLLAPNNNDIYLYRSWDGTRNSAGSIFLDRRNDEGLQDFNTVIYGHNMRNGAMFGSLKHYAKKDYLEAHPSVYIITDESILRYEIFSVYEADVWGDTYLWEFEDDSRKEKALDYFQECSVIPVEQDLTIEDHILTLSTCTDSRNYEVRWVVQAVLTEELARQ